MASVAIKDPNRPANTENVYCIGYDFLGGDLSDPDRWKYDHANYWDYDSAPEASEINPLPVSRIILDDVLEKHNISVEEPLSTFSF